MDRDKEEILTATQIKTWKTDTDRNRDRDRNKQADSSRTKDREDIQTETKEKTWKRARDRYKFTEKAREKKEKDKEEEKEKDVKKGGKNEGGREKAGSVVRYFKMILIPFQYIYFIFWASSLFLNSSTYISWKIFSN